VASTGSIVIISQYLGAGKREEAERMSSAALLVNGALGLLLSLVLVVLARPILELMGLPAPLMDDGVAYLKIVGGASFLQAGITTFSGIVRSYGNASPAMIVAVITNLLNAAGCYIVIYRPFETPFYGVPELRQCLS
jgi:Na+-driven multidrug efflux pump